MLDHTAYPAVVAEIVGHCSVPALVAFRATSRRYQDMVDSFLFDHATIFWQLKDGEADILEPVLFTAPESRWGSARLPWAPQLVKTLDLGWDTTVYEKPAERVPLSLEPGRVLPESSRLVPEFKYAIGAQTVAAQRNHFPPALADKFTNVGLVRRYARAASTVGTSMPTAAGAKTTIVDFVCLSDWWDAAEQNLAAPPDFPYEYLFQTKLALPRQVDRHVLHIGWHEYRSQSHILRDMGIEDRKVDVRELVVVLRPGHDRVQERQVEELEGLTFISYYLLRYMMVAGKVTIVGADSLHPDQVVDDEWDGVGEEGRRWANLGDGAVRRFNKFFAIKFLGSILPGSELVKLREKLTHLTMDEWLGELAREGRALEGEWPGECAATYDDYQAMYG